jgi:biopolymer transport protein ExbD
MSHGGGGDSGVAEPNLTPLLDLVLQLLMFFIMCVNFVADQVSPDVKLSVSDSALPMEKSDLDRLFISVKFLRTEGLDEESPQFKNIRAFLDKLPGARREELRNQDVAILIAGAPMDDYPMSFLRAKGWLKKRYEDIKTANKARGINEVQTVVHIRPDGDLPYQHYFRMMDACKFAGFKKLKVHAVIGGGG